METLGAPQWVGRYRLTSRIATGGMAEVFAGRHISEDGTFGPIVAVKRLLPHLVKDASVVRMFLNEARVTAQIQHPNVVRVFELGQVQNEPFIAMELLEGRTLAELRSRAAEQGKRLPVGIALKVLGEACRGLDAAHRALDDDGQPLALVHRDFTPDNIHVGVAGEVKVIDFGIAKTTSWGAGTEPGTLKGKFFYMSPEMILAKPVDHRADIFAAGVMLYEQLCGHRPFTGMTIDEVVMKIAAGKLARPSSFDPSVPPALETTCLTALRHDPQERFPTLAAFAEAIEATEGLADFEQIGAYVSELFPAKSDDRRITLRRAREMDPSQPSHKGPDLHEAPEPAPGDEPARRASRPALPLPPLDASVQGAAPDRAAGAGAGAGPAAMGAARARPPWLTLGVAAATLLGLAVAGWVALRPPTHTAVELASMTETATDASVRARSAFLLAAAPDATEPQLARAGSLLLQAKQYQPALELSDQWLKRSPRALEARLLEARAALGLRQGRRAEAAVKEAGDLAPGDARPDMVLGELRESQGEVSGALEAWTRAARKAPDNPQARLKRGVLLARDSRWEEAEQVLEAALRKHRDPEAVAELGYVKFRLGRHQEAFRILQRAVREHPSSMLARYYFATALYQRGEVAQARTEYLEADRLSTDSRPLESLCEMEAQQRSGELERTKERLRQRFPEEASAIISRCAAAPSPRPAE